MELRRVAITGMNSISGIGNNIDEMWDNLINGKTGIEKFDLCGDPDMAHFAARVKNLSFSEEFFDHKDLKNLDLFAKFGVQATMDLLHNQSFFEKDKFGYDPYRIGCLMGVGIFGIETINDAAHKYTNGKKRDISYYHLAAMIPNSVTAQISIKSGIKGIASAASSACSSASIAIAQAAQEIMLGSHDMIITGGSDSSFENSWYYGFSKLALTKYKGDDVKMACKPFDVDRKGTVFGEGAGILILEDYEKAKQRGATIYGEIVGFGSTSDAFHSLAMDPKVEAPIAAMKNALKMANIQPSQIDWVSTHSPGTPKGDIGEAQAIQEVFGENRPLITAFKSYLGHSMGASGAHELIALIKSVNEGYAVPTLNLENVDKNCDLNHVMGEPIKVKTTYALKNAIGFGGTNSSLVIKF